MIIIVFRSHFGSMADEFDRALDIAAGRVAVPLHEPQHRAERQPRSVFARHEAAVARDRRTALGRERQDARLALAEQLPTARTQRTPGAHGAAPTVAVRLSAGRFVRKQSKPTAERGGHP